MKYLKMQRSAHNAFCLLLVVEAPDFFVWPIIGTVVDGDYVLISIDESKIDKHFLATFMATSKGYGVREASEEEFENKKSQLGKKNAEAMQVWANS